MNRGAIAGGRRGGVRRVVTEGLADGELLSHLEDTLRGAMWFPEYLRMRYEG